MTTPIAAPCRIAVLLERRLEHEERRVSVANAGPLPVIDAVRSNKRNEMVPRMIIALKVTGVISGMAIYR